MSLEMGEKFRCKHQIPGDQIPDDVYNRVLTEALMYGVNHLVFESVGGVCPEGFEADGEHCSGKFYPIATKIQVRFSMVNNNDDNIHLI